MDKSTKRRRGRPAKNGHRYPGGKLKSSSQPTIEPIAPALWERIKRDAIVLAGDARLGSEVGRLSLHGALTSTQASAAFRFAEIYGRFERLKGLKRSTASPSYMVGSTGAADVAEELLTPEALEDFNARAGAAQATFVRLQNEMTAAFPANVRAALELLCVDDALTNPVMVDNLRLALDRLAVFFKIVAAPKGKRPPTSTPRPARRDDATGAPPVNVDRTVWLAALRKLRPDLADDELSQAYAIVCALKAREVVRRSKTGAGNVVYLGRSG